MRDAVIAVVAPMARDLKFVHIPADRVPGHARTGHTYAGFSAIDPTGHYVAYIAPGAFGSRGRIYVHELSTGRRAATQIDPRWQLGSWHRSRQ